MTLRSLFIKHVQTDDPKTWAVLERRVQGLPSHELPGWANQCLYAIGRNLSEYAKDPSRLDYMDEAVEGSRALLRLLEELQRRIT